MYIKLHSRSQVYLFLILYLVQKPQVLELFISFKKRVGDTVFNVKATNLTLDLNKSCFLEIYKDMVNDNVKSKLRTRAKERQPQYV